MYSNDLVLLCKMLYQVSMHLVISGPYEVLYTTGVDIWSFGCLLLNMLIGKAGPLKQRGVCYVTSQL